MRFYAWPILDQRMFKVEDQLQTANFLGDCGFNNSVEYNPEYIELITEPKLDGLSLALIYRFGKLNTAITRGDGIEGEVVTANAMTIKKHPKECSDFCET